MANQNYQLLDSGDFLKLERLGDFTLQRPAAQAVWPRSLDKKTWSQADVIFERTSDASGKWIFNSKSKPTAPKIQFFNVNIQCKFTDFGHLGFFAEQLENWKTMYELIDTSSRNKANNPIKVLNLFAYTGIASITCALAGAAVTHVDASKTSVAWASENANLTKDNLNIRWIIEDVKKFIQREVRRGNKYDAVILDPPTYGRGNKNEVWKIDHDLVPLLEDIKNILSPNWLFVLLSSHSPGHSPEVLKNLLSTTIVSNGKLPSLVPAEMLILENDRKIALASGSCCWAINKNG